HQRPLLARYRRVRVLGGRAASVSSPLPSTATIPRHLGLLIESDGPGGAEQVVAHLAEYFCVDRAMPVTVFVPVGGEGWLAERLRATPVQVEAVPMGGPISPHAIVALMGAL